MSSEEEQPASSAAAAVSATAAAPVCLVLDLLLFAVEVIRRSKRAIHRSVKNGLVTVCSPVGLRRCQRLRTPGETASRPTAQNAARVTSASRATRVAPPTTFS